MRTLAHLSDLHFGRIDPDLVTPLVEAVHSARPDLVVISGDLTQRARFNQFREAKEFLKRLPQPQIVIPGNHDVPLHNMFARFARPFTRYRQIISNDLEPTYVDDEIAVVCINTAHAMTLRGGGRLARAAVLRAGDRLRSLDAQLLKIVVTHHPFAMPPVVSERHLVRGAVPAMSALAEAGADIFLAGHIHVVHTELTTRRYRIPGWTGLIVQAATGLSTRRRHGQANAFNVLRIQRNNVEVTTLVCNGSTFAVGSQENFHRQHEGWNRAA